MRQDLGTRGLLGNDLEQAGQRGGQMASMKVGAMPKAKILEWLNEAGVHQPA